MFAACAQKVPFFCYHKMADAEGLLPVSQQGERKEEFNFWAQFSGPEPRLFCVCSGFLHPAAPLEIPVAAVQLLVVLSSRSPHELSSFMLSPSAPTISLLLMVRFGGMAVF